MALATAPGCRDATQMTLELSLTPRAQCTEVHGTAITVGADPTATEARVRDEYVTATTTACDPSSRAIGTLVLTPGDSDSASVVVVVAYDQVAPASCKPPAYKGCIVARRRFTFAKHTHLTMPITIDPDCKDVPCDAFSTCRTGVCFDSDVACSGDACTEPGATPDGGTSEAGVVIPDAGQDGATTGDGGPGDGGPGDGSILDGAGDGSTDGAAGDGSVGGAADCVLPSDSLVCGGLACAGTAVSCCGTAPANATCTASACPGNNRYCCKPADCPAGKNCVRALGMGLVPGPANGANPFGDIGTCQ
ncbi:MAG TPA: hypothetical protein VLT33_52060 [Labilithrix sp.]|nr:hypothetical protein [Labilithrix sp.]